MRFNTILFDLDGTLVNTLDDITDSVNAVMNSEAYALQTIEDIQSYIGEGYRVLMERVLPVETVDEEIDRCTGLFQDRYSANMIIKTQPYPEIRQLLEELKEMGIKIGVVSNKMDDATKDICRFFFGSSIDVAVGDNPERHKKPAPDNVFEAMKQLGSSIEKTLYVGDSDVDVQTAKNAGVFFVGVTWGYRSKEALIREGAQYTIDTPNELVSLLT
jgi:phosphoglycolate phosphatase